MLGAVAPAQARTCLFFIPAPPFSYDRLRLVIFLTLACFKVSSVFVSKLVKLRD